MQKDEDIGKIAAYTPVIMAKSTEKFVSFLVNAAVKSTMAESSVAITPKILYQTIEQEEKLDFLKGSEMFSLLKT
jgi:hypothetical protein